MGLGLVFILLIAGAIAYAGGWRPQFSQPSQPAKGQSAIDILQERYARGEIGKEEYEQIRDDLRR